MAEFARLLEDHIIINTSPDQAWNLISDIRRIPLWSPQVDSTQLRQGFDEVGLGARFTNRNHHGELQWTTKGEIVRFDPGREVAFRIEENWVVWSFTLEPTDDGRTRLTERRETPDGISDVSLMLTERNLGGQEEFTRTLRAGMRQTLERIKASCEA